MIEKIFHNNVVLSIIIRRDFKANGIEFFTNDGHSQQLGYMNRPKDYIIKPHVHNLVPREVVLTQEVLFIKSGKVRVDFYDDDKIYLESRDLDAGDVILLAAGGHGFKMIEDSEIIEVKQGPYCGEMDKVRFDPVQEETVKKFAK
jgi:mannose-6-phosphate isomerase-like protein (cupin superfamily)